MSISKVKYQFRIAGLLLFGYLFFLPTEDAYRVLDLKDAWNALNLGNSSIEVISFKSATAIGINSVTGRL